MSRLVGLTFPEAAEEIRRTGDAEAVKKEPQKPSTASKKRKSQKGA